MKRFMFLPLMFTVWFTMSVINTASAGPASEFFIIYVIFCLIVIGVIVGLMALARNSRSSKSPKCLYCSQKMMECFYPEGSFLRPVSFSVSLSGVGIFIIVAIMLFLFVELLSSSGNNEDMFFWG